MRQCRLLFQTVVLGGCKVPFSLLLGQQSGYKSAGLVPILTRNHFTSCHYGVQVFLGALHCRLGFAVLCQRAFQFPERLAVGNLQVYIRKGVLQLFQVGRAQLFGSAINIFFQFVTKGGKCFRTLFVQIAEYVSQVDGLLELPEVQFFQVVLSLFFQ